MTKKTKGELAGSEQIEPLGLLTEKMSRRSFGKLLGLQTMLASTAILSGCGGGGGSDDATDATNATTPTTSTTPTPSSTDTQPLTRGAFVATISDYFNWAHSSEYIDMYRNPQPTFADVVFGTTPYGKQIETALEESVISNSQGYFYPDKLVTREDAAVMYVNAFKIPLSATNALAGFSDASTISTAAKPSVNALVAGGYMSGTSATLFSPQGNLIGSDAKKILDTITGSLVAPVNSLSKPGTTAPRRYVTYFTPTPGATIYITETQDGSVPPDPDTSSTVQTTKLFQPSTIKYDFSTLGVRQYKFPTTGMKTVRVKAVAVKGGMTKSAVREFSWLIYRPSGNPFEARLMHAASSSSPAVWQIYNDSESVQSHAYLVVGTTRAILLDALETDATGPNSKDMKTIVDSLVGGLPYDVLIGHAHGDHAAQMYNFSNAGIKTYATQLCRVELLSQAVANASNANAQATLDQWATAAGWSNANCVTVADGATFPLGNVTCTAFVIPGHTNGQITLLVNETGWVYSSDMWGCNRSYSADTTSYSAVKADLFLSFCEQLLAKYRKASTTGVITEVTNAHQEAGVGMVCINNFVQAYRNLMDNGVSAVQPSIRNGYYGMSGSNGQGMLMVGDMWRNKNWIALEPGQTVAASGTTLSVLSSNTDVWSPGLPLNYNSTDGYKKYSVLSNVEIGGGTLDLSTTTVTWGKPQSDGSTAFPCALTNCFFDPWKYAYTIKVPTSTSSITITPTALSSKFKSMTVNGTSVTQGATTSVAVSAGSTITITIVAADGSTSSTYTFTIAKV